MWDQIFHTLFDLINWWDYCKLTVICSVLTVDIFLTFEMSNEIRFEGPYYTCRYLKTFYQQPKLQCECTFHIPPNKKKSSIVKNTTKTKNQIRLIDKSYITAFNNPNKKKKSHPLVILNWFILLYIFFVHKIFFLLDLKELSKWKAFFYVS